MHLPATSSSWAISDTANRSVSFATGMLAAATSDDINPIALVTCGNFGSLLPLAMETRVKVEQLARRAYTSHVFTYIKAQAGYRKNDSVEQLSRSDSGIWFLCLAATLSAIDHYDAAARLDALLEATQRDQQIRPTIRQLQVMMGSLSTKLVISDLGNNVAGYESMLRPLLSGKLCYCYCQRAIKDIS